MKKPLDDAARKSAPGSFAKLSHGRTHYQWHGRQDGQPLVLVHGFSTPSFVWRGILPPLIEAGFRVLTYDLFGRGWSDRPNADYSLDFYRTQLLELVESQRLTGPFDLAGYSMGGLIATDFTAIYRGKVRKLFLIAPAGLKASLGGVPTLLKIPVIGSWMAENVWSKRLLADMARPENQGKALPDLLELYHEQMSYPGYMRALRSTLLQTPLLDGLEPYRQLALSPVPVGAIWGRKDTVTPPAGAEKLKSLFPEADIAFCDEAYHAITYSHPETVASHMIRHLKDKS